MEQRLSVVTLGVADLGRARAFYEALGWRALPGPDGVVFFQLPGMVFALWSRRALLDDAGLKPTGEDQPPAPSIALAHNCRSRAAVDAVFTEAMRAGGRGLKSPREVFWGGYSGYFADPDGHLWEVAFNPHWTIDAAGGVDAAPRAKTEEARRDR
jgi:hypothetical protein